VRYCIAFKLSIINLFSDCIAVKSKEYAPDSISHSMNEVTATIFIPEDQVFSALKVVHYTIMTRAVLIAPFPIENITKNERVIRDKCKQVNCREKKIDHVAFAFLQDTYCFLTRWIRLWCIKKYLEERIWASQVSQQSTETLNRFVWNNPMSFLVSSTPWCVETHQNKHANSIATSPMPYYCTRVNRMQFRLSRSRWKRKVAPLSR
jgi:hypothetical protein